MYPKRSGEGIDLEETFMMTVERIVAAIRTAGYDPYSQLTGFLRTHDDRYITRTGNARELVKELDRGKLKQYVNQMKYEHHN